VSRRRHPHLLHLLGLALHPQWLCLVLPLKRGGSLKDALLRCRAGPGTPVVGFTPRTVQHRLRIAHGGCTQHRCLPPDSSVQRPTCPENDYKLSHCVRSLRVRLSGCANTTIPSARAAHACVARHLAGICSLQRISAISARRRRPAPRRPGAGSRGAAQCRLHARRHQAGEHTAGRARACGARTW
jgi:hypothetical protein